MWWIHLSCCIVRPNIGWIGWRDVGWEQVLERVREMGGGVEDDWRARWRRTRRWWWRARGGTAGARPVEGGDGQSLHKVREEHPIWHKWALSLPLGASSSLYFYWLLLIPTTLILFYFAARVWMSRDSPRATTTTIGLRGLHCCPRCAHPLLSSFSLFILMYSIQLHMIFLKYVRSLVRLLVFSEC
jgi:hypothetical protein